MSLTRSLSVSPTHSVSFPLTHPLSPSLSIEDADSREQVGRAALTAESIGKHVMAAVAALECLQLRRP